MKRILIGLLLLSSYAVAQDATTYQTPPKALADLVTVAPTPGVSVDSKGQYMVILERAANPTIAELSQPELRLAGVRLNPATNGPSRAAYLTGLKLKKLPSGAETAVTGLPAEARLSYLQWSPDESKIAFTNTTDTQLELYVADVATAAARRVGSVALNAVLGTPYNWLSDGQGFIVRAIPSGRGAAPAPGRVPTGPTVQQNLGRSGQAPTYQDLLKNPSDEAQFKYYATAQVMRLGLDGQTKAIGQPGIITGAQSSPDGRYVLAETVHAPFSYLVPVYRFPLRTEVFGIDGTLVKMLSDTPAQENVPYSPDGAPTGPRDYAWRNDVPATVWYVEAQDGGDPKKKADIRDKVFALDAPFGGSPQEIYAAQYRFGGFEWGDATVALATERWWQSRKSLTKTVDPRTWQAATLFDRSYEDRYSDPGQPDTRRNQYGRDVLNLLPNGELLMLNGTGASSTGDRPFVSLLNLKTRKSQEIWRSQAPRFERPVAVLDAKKRVLLTTQEQPDENPNYYIRNVARRSAAPQRVTNFPHPYPQLKGIQKEQLRYKRADGVELTAMLYLPAGYKKEDGPLPTFLWAYPAEFKSAAAAGQVNGSPYQFNRISYWGAAAFVTMGYAILDNASIPIVGEGDKEPNDTYVTQLVSSAQAAIEEGVRRGVVDANRVAVGGHSYGAFMTANLLSYSKLFRGGIARSGAYNRTLTPFGFQNEQRTYWQAPEVYSAMSPFQNADKMKTPLLLIHGEADNNTGTFPMQSERYYTALKSFGASTRLVLLPYESHGYTAKESLLHMLWEMNSWLDKFVKNAPAAGTEKSVGQAGAGTK